MREPGEPKFEQTEESLIQEQKAEWARIWDEQVKTPILNEQNFSYFKDKGDADVAKGITEYFVERKKLSAQPESPSQIPEQKDYSKLAQSFIEGYKTPDGEKVAEDVSQLLWHAEGQLVKTLGQINEATKGWKKNVKIERFKVFLKIVEKLGLLKMIEWGDLKMSALKEPRDSSSEEGRKKIEDALYRGLNQYAGEIMYAFGACQEVKDPREFSFDNPLSEVLAETLSKEGDKYNKAHALLSSAFAGRGEQFEKGREFISRR